MNLFAITLCLTAALGPNHSQLAIHPEFRVSGSAEGVTLTLVSSPGPVALSASDYRVYRGTTPHFLANKNTLVAYVKAPTGTIIKDTTVKSHPGTIYYYKVEELPEGGQPSYLVPVGLNPLRSSDMVSAAVVVPFPPLNVVFIGDSITEGGWIHSPDQNACEACAHSLALGPQPRKVFFSNQGHSGHTTKDYLPGGQDMSNAEAAARSLSANNPGELIFSIMLGTNDSANIGPNGAPANADQYEKNLRATVKQLLVDFPTSKVVIHRPIWYSSNTHNGATYEEEGLERLTSYFPVVASFPKHFPRGKVFLGDTRGYDYFASNYLSTLRIENGRNGTFYLHPNPAGALDLGQLWAQAILRVIP